MGERVFTEDAYTRTRESVDAEGGSATRRGEQRHREGRGLDPLVDPQGFGVIRRSLNRVEKVGGGFKLLVGQAILKETRFDTTGSMGSNVQLAFDALPRSYKLLKEVKGAPLAGYDLQIINAIFGDVRDSYVLNRSQAEMDEKIVEQLRLMVPEHGGGDADEDPQYGLFGAAYLTDACIKRVGLKHYDITVTDARGRSGILADTLVRVFGPDVFEKVSENGFQMKHSDVPTTKEAVTDLLKNAHAFLVHVESSDNRVKKFWRDIYGSDRVVTIPDVRYLPEVEAAIIGLTEGVLSLQDVEDFLRENSKMSKTDTQMIKRAVAGIPLAAQVALPDFGKVPQKGAIFAKKGDAWPIEAEQAPKSKLAKASKGGKSGSMWL